jgi:hypothetical protein
MSADGLERKGAFLERYLFSHGWSRLIKSLGMVLLVDDLDPNISLSERFIASRADVGLAMIFSRPTLAMIAESPMTRSRLVVVKRKGDDAINRAIDEAGLISVDESGLKLETLAAAFIDALKNPISN